MAVTCYATVSYISCVVMLLLQGVSDGSQPLVSLAYGEGGSPSRKSCAQSGVPIRRGCVGNLHGRPVLYAGKRRKNLRRFPAGNAGGRAYPTYLIVGFLFASISRVTTAFFYAINQNVHAYLLIYGEPLLLFLLLLVLPTAIGIQGTWLAVPISQIVTAAASLLLIWKEKQHTTKMALTDSQNS